MATKPSLFLTIPLALAIAVKSWIILRHVPAMTAWNDELFQFRTAYDLFHWGEPGVPHPQFLYYPPLPALVTGPIHLLGLPPPWTYQLSLVLLNGILATAAVAGHLLFRELFGRSSAFLIPLLLLTSPAYYGLNLMSEPLFLAGYAWFLVFFARFLRRHGIRHAVVAGCLMALMMLTRSTALVLLPVLGLGFLAERWGRRRYGYRAAPLGGYLALLLIPTVTTVVWQLADRRLADSSNWNLSAYDYLTRTFDGVAASPFDAFALLHKVVANLGYVWLGTFGIVAPLAFFYVFSRRPTSRRETVMRLFLLHVGFFAWGAACAAMLHMYVHGGAWRDMLPRYMMYGRYVEYFAVPLCVVAVGVLPRLQEASPRVRRRMLAATVAVTAVFLMAIPRQFLSGLVTPRSARAAIVEPGIGWLLELYRWLGWPSVLAAALLLNGALMWAFLNPRGRRSHRWRWAVQGVLLVLLFVNASLSIGETMLHSRFYATFRPPFSTYVTNHPETAASGVYVDDGEGSEPTPFFAIMLYADHPGKVLSGAARRNGSIREHLGRRPVLSGRDLPGYEILAPDHPWNERTGGLRLYGDRLLDRESLPRLTLTGFELTAPRTVEATVHLETRGHDLRGVAFFLEHDAELLRFERYSGLGDSARDAASATGGQPPPGIRVAVGSGRLTIRMDHPGGAMPEGPLITFELELLGSGDGSMLERKIRLVPAPFFSDAAGRRFLGGPGPPDHEVS